jgi:hypothetical protein
MWIGAGLAWLSALLAALFVDNPVGGAKDSPSTA